MANLGEGLSVAVLGYGMIFVILAIIMLVLVLMKVVFGKQSASEKAPVKKAAPAPAPASNYIDVASIDKEEIVAVTAAALAAADQENNSKCQVRIMSVKQL